MTELFYMGDYIVMTIVTILLALVFLAAWKAPRWVKDLGRLALVAGFWGSMLGMYLAFETLSEHADEISTGVIYGGFRASLIAPMYGMIVYIIAVIISIFQKPKV